MELIDANTKNFLYLTLSQYNDNQHPERMRVSMRRDQPFWAGGNSYIACESFRISAAPNPGGLYYKKITSDWFMGASIKQPLVLPPGDPPSELFAAQSIPATAAWNGTVPAQDHNPVFSEKHLRASNITGVNTQTDDQKEQHFTSLSFDLQLGGALMDNAVSNFLSNDPSTIQEYMGRFLNHYRLSKGAYLRLETQGSGRDNNTPGWAVGKLDYSPSLSMYGSGFGADGLSYQRVQVNDLPRAKTNIGTAKPVTDKTTYRVPKNLPFILTPNSLQTNLSGTQIDEFWTNLGNSLTIQVTNRTKWPNQGEADRNLWDPLLSTPLFEIICPQGCTLRGTSRMFTEGPDNDDMVNLQYAITKFPMTWDGPLRVGTEFTMVVPGGYKAVGVAGSPNIAAGTYHGLVQSVPTDITGAGPFWLYYKVPDLAFDAMNSGTTGYNTMTFTQTRDELLNGVYVFTTTHNPIANSIGAKVNLQISYQDNLPVVPFAGGHTEKLSAILASDETDNVILRRPAKDEDRLIYTPNEFFYTFNKPLYADDSREIRMPYCLQTDENGGFVVRWRDVDPANPSSELIISVTMLEELGLNPWFETEIDTLESVQNIDMYYVKRHQIDDWAQTANHLFRWMKRTDLSNHIPSKPFHPPNNPPESGSSLYDIAGTEWIFVDHRVENLKKFNAVTKRIFPDIETDSYGNPYYIFRELPESGRLTNTQQVSVESFATFSEITIVVPNLPFQPMLGTSTDERILASLRMPFIYTTSNEFAGAVESTGFTYYGDLIFNTEPSRSYLKITTDQQLYDCDCEVRLIERNGTMHVMELPYKGEFQIKLRLIQTQ